MFHRAFSIFISHRQNAIISLLDQIHKLAMFNELMAPTLMWRYDAATLGKKSDDQPNPSNEQAVNRQRIEQHVNILRLPQTTEY